MKRKEQSRRDENFRRYSFRRITICIALFIAGATIAYSQNGRVESSETAASPFSFAKAFTYLFMTLGPLKIIGPFVQMTEGQNKTFKRKLAFRGLLISIFAMLVAATVGAKIFVSWEMSVGSLQLAAGIILFLIALKVILEQYKPKKSNREELPAELPATSLSSLAFSPLAFPTIVTPYGIALLILLITLRPNHLPEIFAVTAIVLLLNLLAMLFADFIMKSALVSTILRVIGSVIGVLQVALGLEVAIEALHILRAV